MKSQIEVLVADIALENNKEVCSRIRKIKFDTDSFPIGINTFTSCYISNNIDYFKTYQLSLVNRRRRIKVADGNSIEVKGKGTVV